jgi:hypothetical protein
MAADPYLGRRPGLVAEQVAAGLIARSRREPAEWHLNDTAALLWLLCNGQEHVTQIRSQVRRWYPQGGAQLDRDVIEGLTNLRTQRLIRSAATRYPHRPLLRVAFCNFWPRFDRRDNYFVWMLAHRFDVILVDPRADIPDIVFYSTHPAAEFDHLRLDRSRTRKILVARGGGLARWSECDFLFTTRAVRGAPADRYQQLPLWSLYVDWDAYEASDTGLGDDALAARLRPLAICNRLYDLLQSRPASARAASSLPPEVVPQRVAMRSRTAAEPTAAARKLTIGMATYDDYDGVYFTVQAIRLYHPEVTSEVEILVVDNNPDGVCAPALQALAGWVEGYRYVPNPETQGTAPSKDRVFREAATPYVMCVDSHVLFAPGAIRRLIEYLDARPDCFDLLQGPMVSDDLRSIATHFDPVWSAGMWGVWARNPRGADADAEPFEIPMQGLGAFACRREAWLGFNPRFAGFGGEEGYIHEKFRRAGRRALCLPFLRWHHRFQRPFGPRYRNTWEDRIRNYFIGADELGLDTGALEAHFRQQMGGDHFERVETAIRAEMGSPFHYFDAVYVVDGISEGGKAMDARLARLGLVQRARRVAAIASAQSPDAARAASHRHILEQARKQALEQILVVDAAEQLSDAAVSTLARRVGELRTRVWQIAQLGDPAADSRAVAYHHSVYGPLLDDCVGEAADLEELFAACLGSDGRSAAPVVRRRRSRS